MPENHSFRAALIQMRSGREVQKNLRTVSALVREAADKGAQYVQTPENTLIMELSRNRLTSEQVNAELDEALGFLRNLTDELGLWLHIGASAVRCSDGMMANRSELIGPDGGTIAQYDKIHMFDADLGGGESYREPLSAASLMNCSSLKWMASWMNCLVQHENTWFLVTGHG